MKPVGLECARSDMDCAECKFPNCNCACHKNTTVHPQWKATLRDYDKKVKSVVPLPSLYSYRVDIAPEELRETLCFASNSISLRPNLSDSDYQDITNLKKLIAAIDLMIGPET
ncbi:MAG: hypothetical protein JWO15_3665 [Sphingomonadales bacterium]|nr:hypothetical protein [Sphingomonadales bacterium]